MVAHIRHLYTDYDKLLKSGSFHDARSTVEQPTLAKLVAWRGDDENGQKVLEDVFREVIVISDDDDDSEVEEEAVASNRDQSVEILSSQARSQPVSLVKTSTLDPLREMSEEAPPGFRFVPAVPKKAADRRGFSRYQAWNRALTKYGNGSAGGAGSASVVGPVGSAGAGPAGTATEQSPRHGQRHIGDSPRHREQPLEAPRANPPSRFETPLHRTVTAPNNAVGIQGRGPLDGQRASQYGPRPILTTQKSEGHLDKSPRAFTASNARAVGYPSTNAPIFVNGHKELHPGNRTEAPAPAPAPPTIRPVASQDYVLPSIEAPWPTDKRKMDNRLENMTKRMSLRSVTPKGEMMSGPGNGNGTTQPGSPDDPMSKRRRLAYLPPIQDSRDPWNRPIPLPVSEAVTATSRSPYRRDDLVAEYRVDGNVRRDYPHQRETALDRIRFVDPMHPHSHSHSQSGLLPGSGSMPLPMSMPMPPGTNGPSDPRRNPPRPAYYGDRSPHIRPAVIESRWESDPAAPPPASASTSAIPAHIASVPSSSGKLYADGFVRQVGFREVRPVEYFHHGHGHGHGHGHPRPQQTQLRAGDPAGQSFRARMPKLPHETAVGTAAAAAAATHTHDQIHSHPPEISTGNRQSQLQSQPQPRSPRERQGERQGQQGQGRPGSGLGKR